MASKLEILELKHIISMAIGHPIPSSFERRAVDFFREHGEALIKAATLYELVREIESR